MVCQPWGSTCYAINLFTEFEVTTFTYYEGMKGNTNVEKGIVWGS